MSLRPVKLPAYVVNADDKLEETTETRNAADALDSIRERHTFAKRLLECLGA